MPARRFDAFDRDALALAEQSAGIGVWSIDLATVRVRGNRAVLPHHGPRADGDSIPVEVVRALRHPDDRERVLAGFREALEGGTDATRSSTGSCVRTASSAGSSAAGA